MITRLNSIGRNPLFFVVTMMGFILSGPSSVVSLAATQADHVILVVLEGVGNESIQSGTMPVVQRLAKDGAVTWNAKSIRPPLNVPAMASLLTGLPVKGHRINREWQEYDFSRSFLRTATIFDYLDLAGGVDTAVFMMDERFYQLSRPEIYVDAQMCGTAKPECNPQTLVRYIEEYLQKVTSEGGYGFRLFKVPGLLVVHLPEAAHKGAKRGWESKAYHKALVDVDSAVGDIIKIYTKLGVLDRTMIIVTGLNSGKVHDPQGNGNASHSENDGSTVPWLASGANVKHGYQITKNVTILDTGATIMEALGLETYTEWDSHAVKAIFQTVPQRRTTGNE